MTDKELHQIYFHIEATNRALHKRIDRLECGKCKPEPEPEPEPERYRPTGEELGDAYITARNRNDNALWEKRTHAGFSAVAVTVCNAFFKEWKARFPHITDSNDFLAIVREHRAGHKGEL